MSERVDLYVMMHDTQQAFRKFAYRSTWEQVKYPTAKNIDPKPEPETQVTLSTDTLDLSAFGL